MKVQLKDGAPRSTKVVEINVSKNGNTLEIGPEGVEPAPVLLEFYRGVLTLRVTGTTGQPDVVQELSLEPTIAFDPAKVAEGLAIAQGEVAGLKFVPALLKSEAVSVAAQAAAYVDSGVAGEEKAKFTQMAGRGVRTASHEPTVKPAAPDTTDFDEDMAAFDAAVA